MILGLAQVFGISITEAAAKQTATAFVVGNLGKMIASSLSKVIPVIGNVACATVAAGLTEALGWETAKDFAKQAKQKSL